jgi:hypothetical protein
MHTVKPHPLSLCGEWGSLGGSLYSAPTTVRQPGYLPPGRGPWALRPRLAAGLPLSYRQSARAHGNDHTSSMV